MSPVRAIIPIARRHDLCCVAQGVSNGMYADLGIILKKKIPIFGAIILELIPNVGHIQYHLSNLKIRTPLNLLPDLFSFWPRPDRVVHYQINFKQNIKLTICKCPYAVYTEYILNDLIYSVNIIHAVYLYIQLSNKEKTQLVVNT